MTTGGVTFKNEVGTYISHLPNFLAIVPLFRIYPFRHGIANVLCVPIADAF